MEAGKLDKRITIRQPVATRNSHGEDENDWTGGGTEFWKCWAEIEPLSGREYFLAQQVQAEVTHKIRIRYKAGITNLMRVYFTTRYFEIVSAINVGEQNVTTEMMCIEKT